MNHFHHLILRALVALAALASLHAVAASPLFEPVPRNQLLTGATYGNGVYAVVGDEGVLLTSKDALRWTEHPVVTNHLVAVAYGNGIFLALGVDGQLVSSTTGDTWVAGRILELPGVGSFTGLAFGPVGKGLFVAVDTAGRVLTSSDGLAWIPAYTTATEEMFHGITFGAGKFVVVGKDYDDDADSRGVVRISSDGSRWPRERYQLNEELYGVSWARDKFIATGVSFNQDFDSFSRLVTSTAGTTWSIRNVAGDSVLYTAGYGNGYYWAAGEFGSLLRSPDGTSGWTAAPYISDDFGDYRAMAANPSGSLIVVGNRLLISPKPGASWVDLLEIDSLDLGEVSFGAGSYVALGAEGLSWISSDRTNWTPMRITLPSLEAGDWKGITFGGGKFVAVGQGYDADFNDIGAIATSPDGAQWTIVRSQTLEYPSDVTYANGLFVAVGFYESGANQRSLVLISPNGTTWTRRNLANPPGSSDGPALLGVSYGSPIGFVAVGETGSIRTSANGIDWVLRDVETFEDLRAVGFQAGSYLAVGRFGEAWRSINGISWTQVASSSEADLLQVIDFAGDPVVLGTGGAVLRAAAGDGLQAVPSFTHSTLTGGTYAEQSLLATGLDGVVAVSTDGRSWTLLHGPGLAVPIRLQVEVRGSTITLHAAGAENSSLRIDQADSLVPPVQWQPLTTVTIKNGAAAATDQRKPEGSRFYRLVQP